MIFNNQKIIENSIIINNWGNYFDFLIEQSESNLNLNSNFKKSITSIQNLSGNRVLMYPKKEDIILNLDKIKQFRPIIVLYGFQKEELEILNIFMRKQTLEYNNNLLLDFLKINFNLDEIKNLSKTKDNFKLLYIFIKLWKQMSWNPSPMDGFFNSKCPELYFSFLYELKEKREFLVLNKCIEIIPKDNFHLIIDLVYQIITEQRNFIYDFFDKLNCNDLLNISKNELIGLDLDKLIKSGFIYLKDDGNYSIIGGE